MINKYIFIKDENYKTSLFNISIENLSRKKIISNKSVGSTPYKIKLLSAKEAIDISKNNSINFKQIGEGDIALISFGGTIVFIDIEELVEEVDKKGILIFGTNSFNEYNEAKILANATILNIPNKSKSDFVFIYFVITKIKGTPFYYLILNDTLVQNISNIDFIKNDIHIQQIKGSVDSLKDCIFAPNWGKDNMIIYPEQDSIVFFDNDFFSDTEKDKIFDKIDFDIQAINCSYKINNHTIKIQNLKETIGIIKINILNNFFFKENISQEKLEWTFIIVKNNCQI